MAPATKATATKEQESVATHQLKVNSKTGRPSIDTEGMSVEDMIALSKQLQEAAQAQSAKLFDDTINFLVEKLKGMGRTKADAVNALVELMSPEERRAASGQEGHGIKRVRAPRGSKPPRVTKDVDSSGKRPELNTTYKNPKTGETWTTKGQLGRTPGHMLEAMKSNTWESMKAKK